MVSKLLSKGNRKLLKVTAEVIKHCGKESLAGGTASEVKA